MIPFSSTSFIRKIDDDEEFCSNKGSHEEDEWSENKTPPFLKGSWDVGYV